jgi:phosphopantothenoylcysteine decarboxylase/phosphopantothenate--cysteine ligase
MRFLVTAGPTEEYLDAVRFLSNPSSGKMGYAVAEQARRRGHSVTLVSGPVSLAPPRGVHVVPVVSAREMHRAVHRHFPRAHAVVMTAAVSDFAPRRKLRTKIKKDGRSLKLDLVPTPDILKSLGAKKGGRILVGFALEVQDEIRHALEKLRAKRLDLIVSNRPATFRGESIRARVITSDGRTRRFPPMNKAAFARRLVRWIEDLRSRDR